MRNASGHQAEMSGSEKHKSEQEHTEATNFLIKSTNDNSSIKNNV